MKMELSTQGLGAPFFIMFMVALFIAFLLLLFHLSLFFMIAFLLFHDDL